MKNILILFIFLFIISGAQTVFAYTDCSEKLYWVNYHTDQANNSSDYNSYDWYTTKAIQWGNDYKNCLDIQQQEIENVTFFNQEGIRYNDSQDYDEALVNFQKALDIVGDTDNKDYEIIQQNMILPYNKLGDVFFKKDDFNTALKYYNQTLKIDNENIRALYRIGAINFQKENYKTALSYFNKAYKYNIIEDDIEILKRYVDVTEFRIKEIAAKKNSVTDDYYSYRGLSYLKLHNIIEAGNKVKTTESNEVIIAVIDDGIYINHPDLSKNIRINTKEIPGDGKDNDKNGYKDDYNGWNFIYDNNNVLPLGTHGTMVAGIIGAMRDNKEGIAGIVKKIKLMPIGVCGFGEDGTCDHKNIIKGIHYAIDNGADIINLSLGGNELTYNTDYNDVIKRAYKKGVIIVVAAGNGDLTSDGQYGVNIDTQPISPISNYGDNPQSIIGVAALDADFNKASWTNYGEHAPFYSLGVDVFSTTTTEESTGSMKSIYNFGIVSYNAYDYGNGTSFATPIIAGIVGLGYNKYGKVRPDLVWDALKESMGTGYIIDASKYIDILGEKINKKPLDYKEMKIGMLDKISEIWYNIKRWFSVFTQSFKKSESTLDSIKSLNLSN